MAQSESQAQRDQEKLERQAQSQAGVRRLIGLLFGFLLTGAIYSLLLNAYLLVGKSHLPAYTFTIKSSVASQAVYQPFVVWEPMTGVESPVRPGILIDGFKLSPSPSPVSQLGIRTNEKHHIDVQIPLSCSAGKHEGRVDFILANVISGFPSVISYPIHLEASSAFWDNWGILGWWLVICLVLLVLIYLASPFVFPAPTGWILITGPENMSVASKAKLRLTLPFAARLLPWRRPVIPIRSVWKQAHVHIPLKRGIDSVAIVFVHPHTPPLLVTSRSARRSWRVMRRGLASDAGRDDHGIPLDRSCIQLGEYVTLRYHNSDDSEQYVDLRYQKR